jgi:hypothetical protein
MVEIQKSWFWKLVVVIFYDLNKQLIQFSWPPSLSKPPSPMTSCVTIPGWGGKGGGKGYGKDMWSMMGPMMMQPLGWKVKGTDLKV